MSGESISQEETAVQVLLTVPLVMRVVSAELRRTKYNIAPAQLGVLTMLAHRTTNLSELADYHAVSLPTMSATVSKITQNGWVARQRSQTDRRVVNLNITDEGRQVLSEIVSLMIKNVTELLNNLSADEHRLLGDGLSILEKVFQSQLPGQWPMPNQQAMNQLLGQ